MYSRSKALHFMRLYWHVFSFKYFAFVVIHINYNEFILKLYNDKIISNILNSQRNTLNLPT